jgi:hypothetical protein
VNVSAAIMAHPERTLQVIELRERLDRDVPVSWDMDGPASGNGDRVWRNARTAWQMHDRTADWHILIQDDALVCRDFLAGMERALQHVPQDAVVSAYLGQGQHHSRRWGRMTEAADAAGASWIRADRVAWGVCLAVPVALIPEMVTYCDQKWGMPDDMRVSAWASRRKAEVWYPWPSLVDHRTDPSLTKHKATERIAWRHHSDSALVIDWGGRVVTDPMLRRRRPVRSGPSQVRPVRSVTTDHRSGERGDRA